jgi:hypothetical protein
MSLLWLGAGILAFGVGFWLAQKYNAQGWGWLGSVSGTILLLAGWSVVTVLTVELREFEQMKVLLGKETQYGLKEGIRFVAVRDARLSWVAPRKAAWIAVRYTRDGRTHTDVLPGHATEWQIPDGAANVTIQYGTMDGPSDIISVALK